MINRVLLFHVNLQKIFFFMAAKDFENYDRGLWGFLIAIPRILRPLKVSFIESGEWLSSDGTRASDLFCLIWS